MIKREWQEDPKLVSLIQAIQQQPCEYPKYWWKDGVLTRKIVIGLELQTRKLF